MLWFNDKALDGIPGLFNQLPPGTDDRSIFKLLLDQAPELSPNYAAMLRMNLALAKERMKLEGIIQPLLGMPTPRIRALEKLYEEAEPARANVVNELPLCLFNRD